MMRTRTTLLIVAGALTLACRPANEAGDAGDAAPAAPDTLPPMLDSGDAGSPPDAAPDGPPGDPWEPLRAAIDSSDLENVTVVVGTAAGTAFVHDKGDSAADRLYPLASASKWLTSLLVLQLVEEGALDLADHPQAHLDWWTDDPADPQRRGEVTLEQLLSFTSGLAGDSGLGPRQEGVPCVEERQTTLVACAREIYEGFFRYAPGSTFHYGPSHMHVAAAMALARTGGTWNDLFRARLGDPLGLSARAGFRLPSEANPRPSGGGTATAEDYAAILTALVAGELLSPESVARLTADHTPAGVALAEVPAAATDGRAWHYGLGCWRECNQEAYTAACDEPGVVSSPGAFGFYPWWDMRLGHWGVVATQLTLLQGGASTTVPLGQAWAELAAEALAD